MEIIDVLGNDLQIDATIGHFRFLVDCLGRAPISSNAPKCPTQRRERIVSVPVTVTLPLLGWGRAWDITGIAPMASSYKIKQWARKRASLAVMPYCTNVRSSFYPRKYFMWICCKSIVPEIIAHINSSDSTPILVPSP